MKKFLSLLLCLCLVIFLISCGKKQEYEQSESVPESVNVTDIDIDNMDLEFTENDLNSSFDESEAIKVTDKNAEITKAGTYLFSGEYKQIKIKAAENDKIRLVLQNVKIAAENSPAIFVEQADKVFITIPESTTTVLSDSAEYNESYDNADGVIFSKADLTVNGKGTLEIKGNYKCGIVSKDDLVIANTTLNIESVGTAVEGKDCVKLTSALLTLNGGTDGIKSTNTEKSNRGFILIDSGEYDITSTNDALQAATALFIKNGDFTLSSGGGSKNSSTQSDNWGMWGPHFENQNSSADEISAKAIKSGMLINIDGGNFTIDSSDDAIHSNSDIEINSGKFDITSGDDGIHADDELIINGGDIHISKSYEGIEATVINVSNGNINVTASDDGFNAAGGNDSSALGGRPGQNSFESDNESLITFGGGYIVVNASGDGIDSNGDISVTNGIILVSGPENSGNGALDYGKTANISGGTVVITGSSGMAQGFSSTSTQPSYMTNLDQGISGGTAVSLCNGNKVIASFTPSKSFNSIIVSSPEMEIGKSYKICLGGTVTSADLNGFTSNSTLVNETDSFNIEITSVSNATGGGMGNMGGMMGGPGGMGKPR